MQDMLSPPKGRLHIHRVDGEIWTPVAGPIQNTVLYDWGFIAAKALGHGEAIYRINAMYIEFSNVAAPGNAVNVPTFSRDEGVSYYNSLSGSNDYLRVPLIGLPSITIETGFESFFTAGVDGNLLTFHAQTAGTVGVKQDLPFSDTVNSKIFGGALVAAPVFADSTQDIVFSRSYFASADQTLKQASSQVGITWELPFV